MAKGSQCPNCALMGKDTAADNLISYPDGGQYCHACSYTLHSNRQLKQEYIAMDSQPLEQLLTGSIQAIPSRGLTKETCEKYGIKTGLYTGFLSSRPVSNKEMLIFELYQNRQIQAQKIRDPAMGLSEHSEVKWLGPKTNTNILFGQDKFNPSDKMVVIVTEGELDSASVYQMTGYPSVSLTKGAGGASRQLLEALPWLQQWKNTILLFDNDEAGQLAVSEALPAFEVGTVAVCTLQDAKDANELLMSGKGHNLKNLLWNAEVIKPKTIVTSMDILPRILVQPKFGYHWPWADLDRWTFGFSLHKLYVVTASEGIGKTEFLKEVIFKLIEQDVKIGLFSFEQEAESTFQRLIGTKLNQRLHLPDTVWDTKKIEDLANELSQKIFLYDNRGTLPIEEIVANIRYLVRAQGVKCIILDNLSLMGGKQRIEGKRVDLHTYQEHILSLLVTLTKELEVGIILCTHVAKDKVTKQAYVSTSPKNFDAYMSQSGLDVAKMIDRDGMNWETGRMPGLENIQGPAIIPRVVDHVFGLARNTKSEDVLERSTTRIKHLKARLDSSTCGEEFSVYYDYNTGRLINNRSDTRNENRNQNII